MPQDFANRRSEPDTSSNQLPRWVWFVSGVIVGAFATFLAFVGLTVPPDPETVAVPKVSAPIVTDTPVQEEMQWNFFDLFPQSEVPVHDNYSEPDDLTGPANYLLQAGSFQNPDDADRLRGELILMGLDANIREIKVNGQKWHRVMVGPLSDEVELNRAQDRLAEIDIAAIPIRVKP